MAPHSGVSVLRRPLWLWCLLGFAAHAPAAQVGWIGTYTGHGTQTTGSSGIYSFHWDARHGELSDLRPVANIGNPSFLALHPSGRFLYATSDGGTGTDADHIVAFAINRRDRAGDLTQLNSVSAGGKGPCHLSIDPTGRWLFDANYASGTIAVFAIRADGTLAESSQIIQQRSDTAGESRISHAHQVLLTPDGRYLLSANLGLDRVFVYRFDRITGTLSAAAPAFLELNHGDGPRHLLFAPGARHAYRVYLINELSASVASLRWDPARARLDSEAESSALPEDFRGKRSGAELALSPHADYLYASCRGDSNTVAIFHLQPDGLVRRIGGISTGGMTPRYIGLDPSGHYLIAANQDSSNLVIFRIDRATGELSPQGGSVAVPAPSDVLFDTAHAGGKS